MIIKDRDFGSLPSPITVTGLEVEARLDKDESPAAFGNLQYEFALSNDGGSTWHDAKRVTLQLTPQTVVIGGPYDLWTKASWTRGELQTDVFQIRASPVGSPITGSPSWNLQYNVARAHFTNDTALTYNHIDSLDVKDGFVQRNSPEETTLITYNVRDGVYVSDGGPTNKPSVMHVVTSVSPDNFPAGVLADFQTAIESTSSEHAYSVQLTIGGKVVLISEPGFATGADDVFQQGLFEIPEITHSGAAGTDSASRVGTATFSLTPDVVEAITTGDIKTVAELSQFEALVGAGATIRLHARTGPTATWVPFVLFKGFVEEALFHEERVELSCKAESIADLPFPNLKYNEAEWFANKDMGGEIDEQAAGAVVPIGMGRFDSSALDNEDYAAGHPMAVAINNRSDITAVLPQMFGIKYPSFPVLGAWQKANPKAGLGEGVEVRSNVVLYGEKRSHYLGYGYLNLETSGGRSNLKYPGAASAASYSTGNDVNKFWRYNYNAVSTWTGSSSGDRARGNVILNDVSTEWSGLGGTFLYEPWNNGVALLDYAGDTKIIQNVVGSPADPASLGRLSNALIMANRLSAATDDPYRAVIEQATILPMEGFSKGGTTTRFDVNDDGPNWPVDQNHFKFFNRKVTNPENCLDLEDLTTFTTVENGGSLALGFPLKAAALGRITGVKVGWLVDGSQANRSSEVSVTARMHKNSLFPLQRIDLNTTDSGGRWDSQDLGGKNGRYYRNVLTHVNFDSSQYVHGSMWISAREFGGGVAQIKQSGVQGESGLFGSTSHGFNAPESWEFLSTSASIEVSRNNEGDINYGPVVAQPSVLFIVGDPDSNPGTGRFTDDSGKELHLIAVWLEVIYESSLARPAEEWQSVERVPIQLPKSFLRGAGQYIPETWLRFLTFGAKKGLDPRKPDLGSEGIADVYVSGRGPFGDPFGRLAGPSPGQLDTPWPEYTGATAGGAGLENRIVERGPDQAALCILYHSRLAWENRAQDMYHAAPAHTAELGSFEAARYYIDGWDGSDNHRLTTLFRDEGTLGDAIDRIATQSMGFCQEQLLDGTDQLVWRFFVDQDGDVATDQPERVYRTDGYNFKLNDMWPGSFTATVTPLDHIGNDLTLRYGHHLATGKWTGTIFVNRKDSNMVVGKTTYVQLCEDSALLYGERKDLIDAPDVWNSKAANALLKWHAASKAHRRVLVQFQTFVNAADLQPGMIIKIDDELGDRIKYPGVFAGADWSDHVFHVTSVVLQKDLNNLTRIQVTALEQYPTPVTPAP